MKRFKVLKYEVKSNFKKKFLAFGWKTTGEYSRPLVITTITDWPMLCRNPWREERLWIKYATWSATSGRDHTSIFTWCIGKSLWESVFGRCTFYIPRTLWLYHFHQLKISLPINLTIHIWETGGLPIYLKEHFALWWIWWWKEIVGSDFRLPAEWLE